MAGLTIQEMRLSWNAARAATLVLRIHPEAVFTSGKRDVMDQARVMASNVVRYGPAWLKDTYYAKHPRMVTILMTYSEENQAYISEPKLLALGFYEQLQEHYAGELMKFPHIRGDAFDIAWPRLSSGVADTSAVKAICETIRALPPELGLEVCLDKEGAHEVIHAQFHHTVET